MLGGDGHGQGREHHQSGVHHQRPQTRQVQQAARHAGHTVVHIDVINIIETAPFILKVNKMLFEEFYHLRITLYI